MMEEKQVLVKKQQEGDALKEMQNHQGWGELTKILASMYSEGVNALIQKDSVEIRARLQAIEDLSAQIKLKIDFAKDASEQLKENKFKIMQPTP